MQNSQQNNKRIAKNTLLLYFRMLLILAISLYTSRVVLDVLGVSDFGIYNVVGGFVSMFAVISGAMTTATQRFLSFEIGKGKNGNIKELFSTAVIIHIILAIIILFLSETIGLWFLNNKMNFPQDRYVAANWVFQFSVFTFIINVISVPYNAAIVAYEHMKAFAYVSIIEVILKLFIVFILSISPIDKLVLYASMLALVAIVIRCIYSIYCNKKFKDCRFIWCFNKNRGKAMFSFVGWNLIGSVSIIAKEQGINVILNLFFGASVNAARGIAYQILHALTGFITNFQMAMNPQIVKSYAAEDKEYMFKLVFRGSKYSYLLLFILSLPVLIEAPFILRIWLREVPEYTVIFIRLILISSLIDSLSGTLITSMHASGKVRDYQIIVGGISLMTLPVVYLFFLNGCEPYWAMLIGIIMSIICLFARLVLLKHTIKLPFFGYLKNVLLRILPITILAPIIPLIVYSRMQIGWISFLSVCIISVLFSGLICLYICFTRNERSFVLNKMQSIIKNIRRI